MSELNNLVWLAPLLPMLAAAWIGIATIARLNLGEAGEKQTSLVISIASSGALLLLLLLDLLALINGLPGTIQVANWLQVGEYHIDLAFMLDGFGLSVATLVALIAFLSIRFSINYLHREAGFQRFFMLLALFNGAMLLIVMAANTALMFIGWELAGVSSFLLIGYAFNRNTATENANRAFITNRIGDAGFILGIFFSFSWLGGSDWQSMAQAANQLSITHAALIAGSFIIAALAKSAQIPFAGWIARALEGPTPSSAVFYGALMVHAGVYLIIRLEPLITQAPVLMLLLLLIGLLSALYGWLCALVQTDVKSSLMFSTTAQIGLMLMACGLGWFELAKWYLLLHAGLRAYQFLHAPALMHLVSANPRPVPAWLANNAWLYNAALRRFWLDPVSDAVLVKPTHSLATDLQNFDERVVNRMVGLPIRSNLVASDDETGSNMPGNVGQGQGVVGQLMESLARALHWFEEHLILKGGGEGLIAGIQHVGKYMQQVETLLSQPRYLILLIAATFVVII